MGQPLRINTATSFLSCPRRTLGSDPMLLNLPHPVPQRLAIPSSVGLHASRTRLLVASIVFNMIATRVPLVGLTRGQVVTTGDNPDQIFDDLLKHSEVRSVKLREYSAGRTY